MLKHSLSRWTAFAFVVACLAFTVLVFAAPASQPATPTVSGIIKLLQNHAWRPAVAAMLTLLIFLWRRYGGIIILKWIPSRYMAWVTALVGMAAALPAHLTSAAFSWPTFIQDGLLTGAEAALFWSTLGKFLFPKVLGPIPEEKK